MANIRIQTHRLKKGMKIVVNVYNCYGVVIVPEGTVVTKDVFELLAKHFVDDVVVEYNPEKKDSSIIQKEISASEMREKKIVEFSHTFQITEDIVSKHLQEFVLTEKEMDVPMLVEAVEAVVKKG